jgi:hypothetical protein
MQSLQQKTDTLHPKTESVSLFTLLPSPAMSFRPVPIWHSKRIHSLSLSTHEADSASSDQTTEEIIAEGTYILM